MKNFTSILLVLSLVVVLTGCISTYTPAVNSTNIQDVDFGKKMKVGEDCVTFILLFVGPFGDASIVEAAKKAGITKIELVDYKIKNFVLAHQSCTVVYGN